MNMPSETHHFVLTPDGRVREVPADLAQRVAAGADRMPEFGGRELHYLQVTVNTESDEEIKVMTVGASIRFDDEGRLAGAEPLARDRLEQSAFEHDACIQLALRGVPAAGATFH